MPNLLPPEEKEILFKSQQKKLAVILGSEIFIFLLCLFFVAFSIKFFIMGETSSQKFFLQQAEAQDKSSDFSVFKEMMAKYNKDLLKIISFRQEQVHFSGATDILLRVQKPPGLYFSSLFLDNVEGKKIKAVITGVSGTRDDLLLYKKNLEAEKKIKNIFFSPDSWVSPKNANFNISLEIAGDEN